MPGKNRKLSFILDMLLKTHILPSFFVATKRSSGTQRQEAGTWGRCGKPSPPQAHESGIFSGPGPNKPRVGMDGAAWPGGPENPAPPSGPPAAQLLSCTGRGRMASEGMGISAFFGVHLCGNPSLLFPHSQTTHPFAESLAPSWRIRPDSALDRLHHSRPGTLLLPCCSGIWCCPKSQRGN